MLRRWLVRPIIFGTLLGVAFFASACTTRIQEQGKKLFDDRCAFCHGRDGWGNGPAASAYSPAPTDFTDPNFWQGNVNQKIHDTIVNGRGAMPAQDLDADQIKAVIAYMSKAFS